MNPWTLLDSAQTLGDGARLSLYQRDTEFSIKAGNYELMNSRVHRSGDALAKLACKKLSKHPQVRVLIGGLGMGYTVRSALNELGAKAQVVVAELMTAVVQWNRGFLADLAGSHLDDNQVTIHEADVAQMIKAEKGDYNAILLDVDNGPQALTRKGNDRLYSINGLNTAFAALPRKGVLGIWSSALEPVFTKRLRKAGSEVDEVGVRADRGSKSGTHHIVWIAIRNYNGVILHSQGHPSWCPPTSPNWRRPA